MLDVQAAQAKKQKAYKYMEKGKLGDAISLLQRIIKSAPNDPEARYMLGCCHARLCQWSDAVKALQTSIQIQPNMPQSHFALAGAYIALGQFDSAVTSLELTLKLDKNMADAHVAMGNIYFSQGRTMDAQESFQTAIKINPRLSDAYLGLAGIDQNKGLHLAAISNIKKSLGCDPQNVRAMCAMATSLANLSQKDEAVKFYNKAMHLDRNSIEAICGLAMMHNFNGEYAEAARLIEPLLKKKIFHSTLGVAFSQCCEQNSQCRDAVDYIDQVVARGGLTGSSLKNIHFAAAKVLDKMKHYDEAFSHYKAANEATRELYDGVAHAGKIANFMDVFSRNLFMKTPKAENNDRRPIFIVGMPRSGTSLTEQILASHPDVYAAGELEDLSKILDYSSLTSGDNKGILHLANTLNQAQADTMARKYLDKLTALSPTAGRITDKMPHNFYLLGFIQILFPSARVIHCTRDPIDTCLSIYFQNFNEHHSYAKNLFDIGTHYAQYKRLMMHWMNVLSLPLIEINYEELVGNQENVTRRMLEFCELEWDDNCLQFYKLKRTVDTASFDQVRQPLYKKSVERWRHYEKYLDDLKEGLRRSF